MRGHAFKPCCIRLSSLSSTIDYSPTRHGRIKGDQWPLRNSLLYCTTSIHLWQLGSGFRDPSGDSGVIIESVMANSFISVRFWKTL